MPFWGIELKPRKPYTLRHKPGRVLHLSQATLGDGSSSKKSIVQCIIMPKGDAISLCTLLPDKTESRALNLEFDETDKVKFSVVGKRSVFLTGYFEDRSEYDEHADDDEEQLCGFEGFDEEAEEVYSSEEDGFADFFVDDDDDEDDSDDAEDGDFNMFPPSPLPNSGVVIEEIVDDENLANGNLEKKRLKKKKLTSCSDRNDASQMQLVVKGESVLVVESEDEDGFPIVHPTEAGGNDQNGDIEDEVEKALHDEDDGYGVNDDEKKHSKAESRLKRKSHAMEKDLLEKREDNLQGDPGVPPRKAAATEKKKKKKQKVKSDRALDNVHNVAMEKSEEKLSTESVDIIFSGNVEAEIALSKDPGELRVKNANKNKQKKKNKIKANGDESNGVEEKTSESDIPQVSSKIKARTYGNGLVVEELSMGKPDGKKATRGSNVSVRYIGKLQKSGKIFDSNLTGKPFKFRLGIGSVIKGWDVGVEGMRMGDKRRLTIPPSMGYGSHVVGKIPPNAWLMFDVELVDVK